MEFFHWLRRNPLVVAALVVFIIVMWATGALTALMLDLERIVITLLVIAFMIGIIVWLFRGGRNGGHRGR